MFPVTSRLPLACKRVVCEGFYKNRPRALSKQADIRAERSEKRRQGISVWEGGETSTLLRQGARVRQAPARGCPRVAPRSARGRPAAPSAPLPPPQPETQPGAPLPVGACPGRPRFVCRSGPGGSRPSVPPIGAGASEQRLPAEGGAPCRPPETPHPQVSTCQGAPSNRARSAASWHHGESWPARRSRGAVGSGDPSSSLGGDRPLQPPLSRGGGTEPGGGGREKDPPPTPDAPPSPVTGVGVFGGEAPHRPLPTSPEGQLSAGAAPGRFSAALPGWPGAGRFGAAAAK